MHDHVAPAGSAELLRRFHESGDEGAFDELARRHGRMVGGIAFRVVGHEPDAEEVCQSTFALLAAKAHGLCDRDDAGLARWLAAVALRLAKNRRRVMGRRRRYEAEHARQREIDRAGAHLDPALLAAVDELVATLPRPLRDAVVARHYCGLDRAAAARALGISTDAFRGRLHRATQLLRERLKRRGPGGAVVAGALGCVGNVKAVAGAAVTAPLPLVPARLVPAALSVGRRGAVFAAGAAACVALLAGLVPRPTGAVAKAPEAGFHEAATRLTESSPPPDQPTRGEAFRDALARHGFGDPPARRTVRPEDNGFVHLLRMSDALNEMDPDGSVFGVTNELFTMCRGETEWNPELAAALLAASEQVLLHWDRMAKAPDLQFPESRSAPYLERAQCAAALIKRVEIESLLRESGSGRALEAVVDLLDVGRRFEAGEGMLSHYATGLTIRGIAVSTMHDIVADERADLAADDLDVLAEILESSVPRHADFERSIGANRADVSAGFSGLLDAGERLGEFDEDWLSTLGWNEESRQLALEAIARVDPRALGRAFAEMWGNQDEAFHFRAVRRGSGEATETALDTLTGERLASELVRLAEDAWVNSSEPWLIYQRSLAVQALARVHLAVARARLDGLEIGALSDLVPTYLPAVPDDPFAPQLLQFDPDRGVIWSVGADGIDGRGIPPDGKKFGLNRDEPAVLVR